jgi:hypothetical protein
MAGPACLDLREADRVKREEQSAEETSLLSRTTINDIATAETLVRASCLSYA